MIERDRAYRRFIHNFSRDGAVGVFEALWSSASRGFKVPRTSLVAVNACRVVGTRVGVTIVSRGVGESGGWGCKDSEVANLLHYLGSYLCVILILSSCLPLLLRLV